MTARFQAAAAAALLIVLSFGVSLGLARLSPLAPASLAITADALFTASRVWTIELSFATDAWRAMEPTDGGPFGRAGRGGPDGRGGPERRPSGVGRGLGLAVASAVLGVARDDAGRSFSRAELAALASRTFREWDGQREGGLDRDRLADRVRPNLEPPDAARPGRGPVSPANSIVEGVSDSGYPKVKADLLFDGHELPAVVVRYKGNSSFAEAWNSLKRSLKLDLNEGGYEGRKLGGVTRLNLQNNVADPGWMNEVLAYRVFRDAGVAASRTSYARVFVTVPGVHAHRYFGLYSIAENVDNPFARDRFGTKKGALFKPVTRQLFEDLGNRWEAYERAYDAKTAVSPDETQRVIDFARLVSHADEAEFAARLEQFLDIDEFARFMAATVWLGNMDSILAMGQNYFVYLHPKTRQFQFIPWDLDRSFGSFPMAVSGGGTALSIEHPWSDNRFLDRVFQVGEFRRLYKAHLRELNETTCRPDRLAGLVDELAPILRPAIREESEEKLARFEKAVAGQAAESVPPMRFGGAAGFGPPPGAPGGFGPPGPPPFEADDGPGPGPPPGGPGGPMLPIKAFATARALSIRRQLAGDMAGTVTPRGGGPGGPPGGPGGPPAMARAGFFAAVLFTVLDEDRDGRVTEAETVRAVGRWFDAFKPQERDSLTLDQLAAGLERELRPTRPPGRDPSTRLR